MTAKVYGFFTSWMLVISLLLPSVSVSAQQTLQQKLEGKTTLADMMREVDSHYKVLRSTDKKYEREWKRWKRWEWYMSARLGHGGEFVNIPQLWFQGLKAVERMQSPGERNINSGWSFVGPSMSVADAGVEGNGIGRVDRLVFHPTNPNIMYACTPGGGLWNTVNDGTSWNNLT